MACGNNKNYDSNLNRVIDLDVVYTGCGAECFGETIEAGMTLRSILDILISNCGDSTGSATWGEIQGNIEDQTDLIEFIQNTVVNPVWGAITGSILNQTDLVNYIAENGFTEDKVGSNLHLSEDGKLNVGALVPIPGSDSIYLIQGGDLSNLDNKAYMALTGGLGGESILETSGANLQIGTGGGDMSIGAVEGMISMQTTSGQIFIGSNSGAVGLNNVINITKTTNLYRALIYSAPGANGYGYIEYQKLLPTNAPDLAVPTKGDVKAMAGNGLVSDANGFGIPTTFQETGAALNISPANFVVQIGSNSPSGTPKCFLNISPGGVTLTNPGDQFISLENIPLYSGMGNSALVCKSHLESQVTDLQNTISALEARIEALENA